MTFYAKTQLGNYSPASVISCSLHNCTTQMVVPSDIPPRQFGEPLGWRYVENKLSGQSTGFPVSSFICHLHVIHPRLEIDETHESPQ